MDCDDQLRVVKCYDDPHPLSPNEPNVVPLAVCLHGDLIRIRDHTFRIGNRRTHAPCPILRMSAESHTGLSLQQPILSPL